MTTHSRLLRGAILGLGAAACGTLVPPESCGPEAEAAGEREGSLPAGRALIPLGSFEEGDYVVRVLVERVLVRNLPFSVEESSD